MRPWQFSKPKNPGFGISRAYYLTVLASRATWPTVLELINPAGEGGAATGFGAPLSSSADKSALHRGMERGPYAVASKDRKNVLQMLLMSKDEASFDPEKFVLSGLSAGADPELVARMRGTWNLAQFRFESHDAMVYPALDFVLGVTSRLAALTDGVVADPIAQRYLLPEHVFNTPRVDPRVDARDHIAVRFRTRPEGVHGYTLGMQKFALPEYEITGLTDADETVAERFMLTIAQSVLQGDLTKPGDQFGARRSTFEAREGGLDRGLWEGIPVYELLPPTKKTASEALRAWAEAS